MPGLGPSPIAAAHAHPRDGPRHLLKQLLQTVEEDPDLRRLAQIVAWAESVGLDAQLLARVGGEGLGGGEATLQECSAAFVLWQETRLQNGHACGPLDPDAACRCAPLSSSLSIRCMNRSSQLWQDCGHFFSGHHVS
jgi:hypothetical protein